MKVRWFETGGQKYHFFCSSARSRVRCRNCVKHC